MPKILDGAAIADAIKQEVAEEVRTLVAHGIRPGLVPNQAIVMDEEPYTTVIGRSLLGAPVINVPEVAILGVHKIAERPVARGGQVVVRPMMNLAIGFDHRVVDGELAVKFLRRVCELLERPELLWFYA